MGNFVGVLGALEAPFPGNIAPSLVPREVSARVLARLERAIAEGSGLRALKGSEPFLPVDCPSQDYNFYVTFIAKPMAFNGRGLRCLNVSCLIRYPCKK